MGTNSLAHRTTWLRFRFKRSVDLSVPLRKEKLMEIQQHDSVVVEAAGFQQGCAKHYWRRKRCHGREREAPGAWVRLPSLPLFI